MMNKLTLQKRMFGGLTLMMSLSLLVFGYFLVQLGTIEDRALSMRDSSEDGARFSRLAEEFNLVAIDALQLMLTNPDAATALPTVDKISRNFIAMNEELAGLEKVPNPQTRAKLADVRKNLDLLNPVWAESEGLYRAGNVAAGSANLLVGGRQYGVPMLADLKTLQAVAGKIGATTYQEMADTNTTTRTVSVAAMGLAILGTVSLMWFIVRSVSSAVGRSAS
ncbi:MAG: hypothetical protein HYR89_11245, partial [Actinobacteria bacterium]|nr:hypothetical protein [Actinomycetota bacterium]